MLKSIMIMLGSFIVLSSASAELPPNIVDIIHPNGHDTYVRGINDSGQVAGFTQGPDLRQIAFRFQDGTFDSLDCINGGYSCLANGINNSGMVVGSTNFDVDGKQYDRGTLWSVPGAGIDLQADNTPDTKGSSSALAINNAGVIVGNTTYCFSEDRCTGVFPAIGNPLRIAVSPNLLVIDDFVLTGNYIAAVNNSGIGVGHLPVAGQTESGAIFNGGAVTNIPFNPRAILSDGTVVGDGYRTGGVRIRPPGGGQVESINCGKYVADANDAGDILTYDVSSDGMKIWHEGQCYKLSDLLPDGVAGYTFPSSGASSTHPAINELGQISTSADKVDLGKRIGVILTPQYPFAIEVTTTPTGTVGEYDFEAVVKRANVPITVVWDFGDGSTPHTTGGKTRKKFTKPGSYTVKAVATDNSGSGLKSTRTFTMIVAAPKLQIGITVPNYDSNVVPLDKDFQIVVNVSVSDDGVGDISDITFQGGTFTVSDGSILSFTTASTSPFSISPGGGQTYPLNVKSVASGQVTLTSLIIGKDASGKDVSATTDRTLTIGDTVGSSPDTILISKIDEALGLIKKLKSTAPKNKNKRKEQKQFKARLKVLARELVAYLAANKNEIKATSGKVNLTKLATSAKKAVTQAIKIKKTFAYDKKTANKSLTKLKKGISLK